MPPATAMDCKLQVPYGIMCLTLFYLGFVLLVAFLSPVECLDEPCNSEGLDNSVLGWATDFLIALLMILFGLHLWWLSPQIVFCSAVVALVSMGIAYILGGIGHSIYTNSGFDDNAGQQGFYIVWAISFTFMTLSVEETHRFTRQITAQYTTIFKRSKCLKGFLDASLLFVAIAWMFTVGGYIWCAAEHDLHVDGTIDTVSPFENDEIGSVGKLKQCLRVASIAEISWYTSFSLFWIAVGITLRRVILVSDNQPRFVYGLSNAWAAICVAIIPWTFGIMLIVWSGVFASALDLVGTKVYADIYGAVIYHYGMLLGYYLFYNLAYSLPVEEQVPMPTLALAPEGGSAVSTDDAGFARTY